MQDSRPITIEDAARAVARKAASLAEVESTPVIGINGAQGSGKSTLARLIEDALEQDHALSCAVLSLDDFYLTHAQRAGIARRVHPLCATRGVPGTHDLPMLRRAIEALRGAEADGVTGLARFDKLADDRDARSVAWRGRPHVVLLEGWCVGIREADLPPWTAPTNDLEAECDRDGAWFGWSRGHLPAYERLWDLLALMVSIEVPDLDTVIESRLRQERGLALASGRAAMDRAAVTRFVEHYERYTRALWPAMRARADTLFRRDQEFRFFRVR